MNKYIQLVMLLVAVGVCRPSLGEDCRVPEYDRYCCPPPCWCPDDYRPKCGPCICPPQVCGRCDDYCWKCPPRICLPCYRGGCDDYRPKCSPRVCWPCKWPGYYKCPPPPGGAKPQAAFRVCEAASSI